VVNGWIDKPALSDCIQAAKEALGGKPIAFQSGNMIFAY
jgi:hypothetical protein